MDRQFCYVLCADHSIHALDARTGAGRWHQESLSPNAYDISPAMILSGSSIFTFTIGSHDEGQVYSFHSATGTLRWTRKVRNSKRPAGSPAFMTIEQAGDAVAVSNAGTLQSTFVALDAQSGVALYEASGLGFGVGIHEIRAIGASFLVSSSADPTSYYLVDPFTRRLVSYPPFFEALLVSGSTMFVSYERSFSPVNGALESVRAIDVDTGRVLWSTPEPPEETPMAVLADGEHIFALAPFRAAALDAGNGGTVWVRNFDDRDSEVQSGAVSDGRLFLGTFNPSPSAPPNGRMTALDDATGATNWAAELADAPSDLVVAQGTLFAAAGEQAIYALDVQSGQTRWIYATDAASSFVVG